MEQNIPVVLLNRRIPDLDVDVVLTDNVEASKQATEHLVSIGYRRIGIITGPLNSTTGKERLEGYLETLRKHSIREDEDLMKVGDYKTESGYLLTLELLSLTMLPTAILAGNNLMGLGTMHALREREISIPEDIGLVIFDDLPWFRYLDPPLTAVVQPSFKLGQIAAQLLVDRMKEKRKKPKEIILKTELRIRYSAGEALRNTSLTSTH